MYKTPRRYQRLQLKVPVEMRPAPDGNPIHAVTTDLSAGGFYVEMMFTLAIGTQVHLVLQLGESTVLALGQVVTCDPTVGNGVRLTRMLPEDRQELERFLQSAEAAKASGAKSGGQ
ncbi:MAG: PilZ domain-containing protein [Terriglobales bacterium]|jgi:c-di-GMP-binding flagellar brake protein YcgR